MGVYSPRLRFVRLLYGTCCPKAINTVPAVSTERNKDCTQTIVPRGTAIETIRDRDSIRTPYNGRTAPELLWRRQWITFFC
jgi:hypothetical protein